LERSFKTQNVPCVPSLPASFSCQMVQVRRLTDLTDRPAASKNGTPQNGQLVRGKGPGDRMKNKAKDNGRKWMWWFLAVVVALQLYFVKELLAAFALFAMGFAAIAFVVSSVYALQKGWEVAVVRVAESGHPVVLA